MSGLRGCRIPVGSCWHPGSPLREEASHHPSELPATTAFADLDLSPTAQGLESHKHMRHASAFVVRVETSGTSGGDRQRVSYLSEQLAGSLVETDNRSQGIVGLLVEVQDLLHSPDEGRTLSGWDHPMALEVWLEAGFLSVRRTVS